MKPIQFRLPLFLLVSIFIATNLGNAQSAKLIKKTDAEIREQMQVISRHLGVTCIECHSLKDFKDGKKKSFQVSLEHMQLTELLRQNGMNGKKGPEASCYMCHRGELRPPYREKPGDDKIQ